jgi:PiT family inorganic phosphate transporter
VVSTIKKGIIDPGLIADETVFIWVMMAALLAAAIWLNIATVVGAPVSTTHSIVGGVLGAGIAAAGWEIANWATVGKIAASWVISPVLGGIIAALFLYVIKRTIVYKADKITAAKKMVPILVGIMTWAFSVYLIMKGLKKLWKFDILSATAIGLGIALVVFVLVKPLVRRAADKLENNRVSVNALFTLPLIFAAALLSFAHGANDVANAVGPLAAINDAILHGGVAARAEIPLWVMLVGASGIVLGLALYGPKLIRTVGSEITELDKMRAFCVAMAAAITVIIASQLGLPVSSTHIAVGGIFGVGFLREYLEANHKRLLADIRDHHAQATPGEVDDFLDRFEAADVRDKGLMLTEMKKKRGPQLIKADRKELKNIYREELVKRSILLRIAAAWVVTVPVAGVLAAMLYFTIRGMLLPH